MTEDSIWKLNGCVQHYPWGGQKFIPELMCLANDEAQPFAELWFGQHPACPSITAGGTTLSALMASTPEMFMTPGEQKKWKNELPFLCKILDVNDMLSIQIHPDQEQAKKGYLLEQQNQHKTDEAKVTFRDQNHKPEIMYALSDFYLLHDFRKEEEVLNLLENNPALSLIADEIKTIGLPEFYRQFMQKSQRDINKSLLGLVNSIKTSDGLDDLLNPVFWVSRAIDRFCSDQIIDRGILSFYLMNLVHLKPGEVIFQDSGIPHAYLKGQNIEIMANSDNVIRGGLTRKHIDTEALSRLVRFDKRQLHYIHPTKISDSHILYQPPVDEFQLSVIDLEPYQKYSVKINHISLLFSTCNCFMTRSGRQELRVGGGEAVLVRAGESIILQSRMAAKIFLVNERI